MARIGRARPPVEDFKLAYDYARYSTDKQESIEDQQLVNLETAEDAGVTIIDHFKDEGISRTVSDREGLQAMFAAFRAHPEVRYLVVNELPRLTAGIDQRKVISDLCKDFNITILTEDFGEIDPFDDKKMQAADEQAVKDNAEVIRVRGRTKRALRAKVLAGLVVRRPCYGIRMQPVTLPDGSTLPIGTSLIDEKGRTIRSGKIETHPDELPWLEKIFEWAGEGMSGDAIAKRLNDLGVPTKTGTSRWRQNTIGNILANPLYKGTLVWGLQEVKRGAHGKKFLQMREEGDRGIVILESPLGPLVDPDLFDRLEARRDASIEKRQMTRRTNAGHALDQFVHCGKCGYRMYGRNDVAAYISRAKREGKPYSQYEGKVIWRYVCNSARSGTNANPGFEGLCTKAWTMPVTKIIASLETAGIAAALPKGVKLTALDIPCPTCSVRPGEKCVSKGGRPYRLNGGPESDHNTRREVASSFAGGGADSRPVAILTGMSAEPTDVASERRAVQREIAELDELLKHNYNLITGNSRVPAAILEAKIEELQGRAEEARGRLEALSSEQPKDEPLTARVFQDLAGVAEALRSQSLPLDDKVDMLRRAGIGRIFVNDPLVHLELVG
jgi:DNA invertase Pin-like site-specific DNA recombinase